MQLEQSETDQTEHSEQKETTNESKEEKAKAAKAKAAKEAKRTKEQKHIERLMRIAKVMKGEPDHEFLAPDKTYRLLDEKSLSGHSIVSVDKRRCIEEESEDNLILSITDYLQMYLGPTYTNFRFFNKVDVDKILFYFYSIGIPLPVKLKDVKQFAMLSDPDLAFVRLPFDFKGGYSIDDCPTFKDVLSSVEYGIEGLLAFIGSIFDHKADRSQYLYLFGEGGSGKSTIASFLRRALKSAAVVTEPPPQKGKVDKFFMSLIYRSRLIIFQDVEDFKVVSSAEVKTLTGDAAAKVEHKGVRAFNSEINCKLMLCSNHEPGISSKKSDTRRIIPVKMIAPPCGPKYSTERMTELLDSERERFLNVCWSEYQKAVKDNRGMIPVEHDEVLSIAGSNEDDFHSAVEDFIFFDPDVGLTTNELRYVAKNLEWNKSMRFGFTNWLKEKGNVKYKHSWLKGSQTERTRKAYYGVGIRAEHRRPAESPVPQWPSWTERTASEWKAFVEGLGHKVSSEEARELMARGMNGQAAPVGQLTF